MWCCCNASIFAFEPLFFGEDVFEPLSHTGRRGESAWEKPLSLWERGWGKGTAESLKLSENTNKRKARATAVKRQKKALPGLRALRASRSGFVPLAGFLWPSSLEATPSGPAQAPLKIPSGNFTGFSRWLHRYGFMGPQKHKNNSNSGVLER